MSQSSQASLPTHPPKNLSELTKILNTAVVASHANQSIRDFSSELYSLVDSPSFEAILYGIKRLSETQGISERQAAEQVVKTFQKLDQVWTDYLFQEGVDRVQAGEKESTNC